MSICTEIFVPAKLRAAAKRFKLSPRELQCLVLLSGGETLKGAGDRLSISPRTVELHVNNFRRKLKANNSMHALAVVLLLK